MGRVRVGKLRRWCNRVTLVLDADKAGGDAVQGRWKEFTGRDGRKRKKHIPGLRDILRPYFVVRVATLPQGEDPASLGQRVVEYARDARYI